MGAAYLFSKQGSAWVEILKIDAPAGALGNFGHAVGLEGSLAVIGAPGFDTGGDGEAWVFDLASGTTDRLAPTASSSHYGSALAIDGGRILVGAARESGAHIQRGAAYLYESSGGAWVLAHKFLAQPMSNAHYFGTDLDIHGDLVIIGAPGDDSAGTNRGAAFAFDETSPGTWLPAPKVLPTNSGHGWFGSTLELAFPRVAIGAIGSVELYTWNGVAFVHDQDLIPPSNQIHSFGQPVAFDGVRVIAGEGSLGSVHVYEEVAGSHQYARSLWAIDARSTDEFGESIAIDGDLLMVGARSDSELGSGAGSVYPLDPTVIPFARTFCNCEMNPCTGSSSPHGCQNSASYSRVRACGTASVSADDLELQFEGLPPGTLSLLVASPATGPPVTVGSGLLCLQGPIYRGSVVATDASGNQSLNGGLVAWSQTLPLAGQIDPGDTFGFQLWYRDPTHWCSTSNVSLGLEVTFTN